MGQRGDSLPPTAMDAVVGTFSNVKSIGCMMHLASNEQHGMIEEHQATLVESEALL